MFSRDELKNKIKRVIKPESSIKNLEQLLDNFFETAQQYSQGEQGLNQETETGATAEEIDKGPIQSEEISSHPGMVGLWAGPRNEEAVGVVVPQGVDDLLQLYEKERYGYRPEGDAVHLEEWNLVKELENVEYVAVSDFLL